MGCPSTGERKIWTQGGEGNLPAGSRRRWPGSTVPALGGAKEEDEEAKSNGELGIFFEHELGYF
jgi:hypothetical protein